MIDEGHWMEALRCNETKEQWMARLGLKESHGHVCVRRLALGRCGTNPLYRTQDGCSMFWRVFDHESMYLYDGEPACIVGHEYHDDALRRWLELLDRWPQLDIKLDGASWHHPNCFKVTLQRARLGCGAPGSGEAPVKCPRTRTARSPEGKRAASNHVEDRSLTDRGVTVNSPNPRPVPTPARPESNQVEQLADVAARGRRTVWTARPNRHNARQEGS